MSEWMELTLEEENLFLKWIVNEIINKLKQEENLGEKKFKYMTKLKLQKLTFLVIEDCKIDATRFWYRYGCIISPPFDLHAQAKRYYYNLDRLSLTDKQSISQKLQNIKKEIIDTIEKYFPKVFYTRTDDFLNTLYEDRAPEQYKEIYKTFRNFKHSYLSFKSKQTNLDVHFREFSPNYDPWRDIFRFQRNITRFHLSLSNILTEELLGEIVNFTDLIEKAILVVSWVRKNNRDIKERQYQALDGLEKAFEEHGWALIAKIIAINTVKGVRAEKIRREFEIKKLNSEQRLPQIIREEKQQLIGLALYPTFSMLKKYFKTKYGNLYRNTIQREILG